jgi:hypothetical protein
MCSVSVTGGGDVCCRRHHTVQSVAATAVTTTPVPLQFLELRAQRCPTGLQSQKRSMSSSGSTRSKPTLVVLPQVKVKLSRYRHVDAKGERTYSFSFLTLAPEGGEWSASRPVRASPLGKGPPVPIG